LTQWTATQTLHASAHRFLRITDL